VERWHEEAGETGHLPNTSDEAHEISDHLAAITLGRSLWAIPSGRIEPWMDGGDVVWVKQCDRYEIA
jgi:hypothetical protein